MKINRDHEIGETLNYLAGTGEFGHLAFNDILRIEREIHLAVERTEEKYAKREEVIPLDDKTFSEIGKSIAEHMRRSI